MRATKGSMAICFISMPAEIASVVPLPRNDIVTQSLGQIVGTLTILSKRSCHREFIH
jgi:hypothetical protein